MIYIYMYVQYNYKNDDNDIVKNIFKNERTL